MLVTRQCDTGRYNWSSSKLKAIHHNDATPRMSNLEQLTTQPDWRKQYSQYLPTSDNNSPSSGLEQPVGSHNPENPTPSLQYGSRPQLEHRHSLAQLDTRLTVSQPPIERPGSAPGIVGATLDDPNLSVSTDVTSHQTISLPMSSHSPATQVHSEMSGHTESDTQQGLLKEEVDDDEDDDDDMLELEEGEGKVPQTDAERRAERRKMKRFRLTHQQTRFLMSEFAKQAHPDAAHRERLSGQIPGLSPRQVQVWFQNRRAKIKRLTVDDRERMMKMRAVPDDFDNIQALHSPYGAVHGVGTLLVSPIDYTTNYADHGMRPLMVDTMRRQEGDEHLHAGLSPAFGHVGFAPPGSMGSPDILSPLSLTSTDRYYGSHLTSPLSAGTRNPNPFNRQNSSDSYPIQSSRQNPRPIQPIQLRETMSRSRSESLQSPLRTSMSWKGDSLDYTEYSGGQTSPNTTGRQQSQYQPQLSNPAGQQYDADAYSASQSQMPYPMSQPPSMQSSSTLMPRFRSASSAFPQCLDLRNQYRAIPSQHAGSSVSSPRGGPPPTPRGGGFVSSFSNTGFQSAPLTSPAEFQVPRTPVDATAPRDYQLGQMSAPMAPPQDFANAYSHNLQSLSPTRAAAATSLERGAQQMVAGAVGTSGHGRSPTGQSQEQPVVETVSTYLGQDTGSESAYDSQGPHAKRKRGYSMGGGYEGHVP